jgi:hypothetical protein
MLTIFAVDYQNISKGLAVLALEVNADNQRLVSQKHKLDKGSERNPLYNRQI